jgi:DNA-binding transcriptional ArsR family regulator
MLELFFNNTEEMYYVREITRLIKEEINAVRRELDRMQDCGLLKSEKRGNRLYYYLNKRFLYYGELQNMISKSTGIGKKIRRYRRKLGSLSFVMFSGNFVSKEKVTKDDLDILVIGDVVLPELEKLIKDEEKNLGREINYAVLSDEEFEFRKTRRDPFIMEAMYGVRVMVLGNELEFCHREKQTI